MQFGRFRLGMRTLKSALAVMICILFSHVFNRGPALIASLAAVFSLRQDLTTSVSFGKSRIIGNSIGGLSAILYFLIKSYFQNNFFVELLGIPFFVIVVIVVSDGIDNNAGIISAIATLLMITMSVPTGESVIYALQRVFDTFVGTFIAVGINFFIKPPTEEKEKQIVEDLDTLRKKEEKLTVMLQDVQEQIHEQSEDENETKK